MIKADPSSNAIEMTGLTKSFGKTKVVNGLTVRIPRGSAFGFIGPNGAGKSTTIKMLMGMLSIDSGTVRVLGLDPKVDALSIKQRVGYVPEQQFIYRWMRVSEAVNFCRAVYSDWNDELCSELLALFQLAEGKRVRHLSKGMLVKLSLVLALAHEPELLILDEPMAGLDALAREEFLDGVLQRLCEREHTIVFSSHLLGDVQRMADTIGLLHQGRLIAHDSVDGLLQKTKRIRAILSDGSAPCGCPDGTIWQRVRDREWLMTVRDFNEDLIPRLTAANRLENVDVFDLRLEDIFKDYVRGEGVTG